MFVDHFSSLRKHCVSSISASSSSGGDGPDTESVGKPKCFSSKEMLSTLFAFLQSFDTEPYLRMNSLESNPGPLYDVKMAEFILGLCVREW